MKMAVTWTRMFQGETLSMLLSTSLILRSVLILVIIIEVTYIVSIML